MALALTIADAGDGTGGTATVAGTGGAASVSLYRAAFTGEMGAQSWTLAGTRTGDGTIALASPSPVPLGFWLWRADSVLAGVTSVASAYQNLTDATKAFQAQVLDAVAVRIRSLGLAGLDSVNVRRKWTPRKVPAQSGSAVFVCPGEGEGFPEVMTGTDDTDLPVAVHIITPIGDDETADLDRVSLWRQKILRAVANQRLDGVPQVLKAVPYTARIFDQAAFTQAKHAVGSIGFRFRLRWTRGLS